MFHSVSLIAEVLINLQQHGNDQYMGWQMKFQCNTHNIVDELQNMASKMEKDLTKWKDEVKDMRKDFYQLNYFTTQQLLQLRKELGRFKNPDVHVSVNPQVMALLQCISHDITSDTVIEQVHIATAILKEQSMAEKQYSQERVIPVATGIIDLTSPDISNTTEPSISSKISLATSGPQPTLREDKFTDKQRSIMNNLKESAGFHHKLVMFAFERCTKPDIEEEIEQWCNEHQDEFDLAASDTDVSKSEDSDIVYIGDDFERPYLQRQAEEMHVSSEVNPEVQHKMPRVEIVECRAIDKNHEVVKDLLLAGYELEECMEAASLYPHDSEQAMLYLEQSNADGEAHEGMFNQVLACDDNSMELDEQSNLIDVQDSKDFNVSVR